MMRGAKILIVDDDEMLLEVVQRKLDGDDFQTITATTAPTVPPPLRNPP